MPRLLAALEQVDADDEVVGFAAGTSTKGNELTATSCRINIATKAIICNDKDSGGAMAY